MCPLQHRSVVHIISIVGVGPINIHWRVVHIISIVRVGPIDIHWRVVHIISIVGVGPIDIHRRVVHIISIVGVGPIDIHQRVVHKKIDYRSQSTIYIGGLSTVKNKYLCLEMVFIHGKMHV